MGQRLSLGDFGVEGFEFRHLLILNNGFFKKKCKQTADLLLLLPFTCNCTVEPGLTWSGVKPCIAIRSPGKSIRIDHY